MSRKRPRREPSVGGGGDDDDIFWGPTFFEEESVSGSENCINDNVPDFDSFKDQQEAQPQPPSFVTTHCIFCKTDCVAKFIVVNGVVRKVKCEDLEGGSIAVKRQLKSLFIIRNILGVKEETCYKLLNDFDGQLHPELWINVCSNCDAKVENYYERVKEIARLERRSKTIVLELKRAIWESHNNDRGGGGDNEEEVGDTDFDGVWKEIREEALVGFDPSQNQPEIVIVKEEQNDDLTIMIFMILMFFVLFGDGRGRAQNSDVVPPLPPPTSSSSSPHSPPSPETATGSSEPLEAAATTNSQEVVTDDIRQTAFKRELNSPAAEEENEETGTLLEQRSSTQPILPPLIITNVRTATSSLLHAPVTEVLTSGSLPTQVHSPKAAHNDNYSSSHASPTTTNSIMAAPVGMDTTTSTTLGDDRVQETDDSTNFTEPRPIPLDNKIPFEGVCQEVEPAEILLTGRNEVIVEKIMCVEVGEVFQVKEEAPLPIPPPKPKLTRRKTVMKPQLQSERGPKCWPSAPRVLRKIKPRPIRGFGESSHFSVPQTVTEAPSSSTPSGDKELTTNSSVLSSQSANPAKSKQQPQHNLLTKEKRASITNPTTTRHQQIQKVVQEYFGNEYVQRHVDKEASHSSPNPTLANSSAKVKAVIPHSLPHSSPSSSSSAPHCPPLIQTRTDSSEPLEAASTANSQQGVTDDSQPIKPTAVGSKLNSPAADGKDEETGTLSESEQETGSRLVPLPLIMTSEGTATSSLTEVLTSESSPPQVTTNSNSAPTSELVHSSRPADNDNYSSSHTSPPNLTLTTNSTMAEAVPVPGLEQRHDISSIDDAVAVNRIGNGSDLTPQSSPSSSQSQPSNLDNKNDAEKSNPAAVKRSTNKNDKENSEPANLKLARRMQKSGRNFDGRRISDGTEFNKKSNIIRPAKCFARIQEPEETSDSDDDLDLDYAPTSELVNSPKPIATTSRYNLRTRQNIRSPGQTGDIARDQQVRNNGVAKSSEPMAVVSNELNISDAEEEDEEAGTLLDLSSSETSSLEADTSESSLEVVADIQQASVGSERISLIAEVEEEPGTFSDPERSSPPLPLPPPPPVISTGEKRNKKRVKRKENNLVNCLKCPARISKHLTNKHYRLHQVGGRGTPCPACGIYVDKSRVDFHRRSDKCLKTTNDIPESDDSRDSDIEEVPVVRKPIPLVDISDDDEEGSNSSIQMDSEDDEIEVVGEVVIVDEDDEVLSDTDDTSSSSESDIGEDEDSSESETGDPKDKEKGSSKEKRTDRETDSDSDDGDSDNDDQHQNPEQEGQSSKSQRQPKAAEGVATLATVTQNEVPSSSSQPLTSENDELDLDLQQLVDSFEKVEGGSPQKKLNVSPLSSSRRENANTSDQIPTPAAPVAVSVGGQSKKAPHPNYHQETFLSFRISLKSVESNRREGEEMRSLGEHLITERNNREMERSRETNQIPPLSQPPPLLRREIQSQTPSIKVPTPEPDPFSSDSDADWCDPTVWQVDSKDFYHCKRCPATFTKSSEREREKHSLLHDEGRGKTCPHCKMVVPFLNRHKLKKGECIKPPLPPKPTSNLSQKRKEMMSKKKKIAAFNKNTEKIINVPETETETPSAPDLNQGQNEQVADLNGGDPNPPVAVFAPPPPPVFNHPRSGKRFSCPFCRFSIPMKERVNHETNECENHPSFKGLRKDQDHYKCKECSAWIKPTPNEDELHHHLELHKMHPSTKVVCLVCKWVVDNICRHNEEWHLASKAKRKSNEWALRPNFWVVDATSSPNYIVFIKDKNLLKYKCQRCPAEEQTKWEMEKHSKFHIDGRGSTCLECGWLVVPGGMEEHEKRHSSSHLPRSSTNGEVALSSKQARRNEQEAKYWKCWQCGGSFPDAEKQEHWDLHKNGNGANCRVCGLMVRTDLLAQHLASFHPELGFTTYI